MKTTNKTMWLSNENNILEVMYEGDKTKESNKFEAALIKLFKMHRGAKVQIIKANYDGRKQLSGVYNVKECRKIGKKWSSLDSFLANVAEMIGFEIAERSQCSDNATLVNESGFKLSATLEESLSLVVGASATICVVGGVILKQENKMKATYKNGIFHFEIDGYAVELYKEGDLWLDKIYTLFGHVINRVSPKKDIKFSEVVDEMKKDIQEAKKIEQTIFKF